MTDVTALIQELVDAGCDPVIAGSVVARALATGISTAPYRVRTNAERQANHRARNSCVTKSNESNETVTPVTSALSILEFKKDKKERDRARGTRITPDWEPGPEGLNAARQEGMPEVEIPRTVNFFRDYWIAQPGAKGVKLDWPATWRNWVRRVCDDRGYSRGPPKQTLSPDESARLFARYEERKARME